MGSLCGSVLYRWPKQKSSKEVAKAEGLVVMFWPLWINVEVGPFENRSDMMLGLLKLYRCSMYDVQFFCQKQEGKMNWRGNMWQQSFLIWWTVGPLGWRQRKKNSEMTCWMRFFIYFQVPWFFKLSGFIGFNLQVNFSSELPSSWTRISASTSHCKESLHITYYIHLYRIIIYDV